MTNKEKEVFFNVVEATLRRFGVYKDGEQVIGCADTPIKEVMFQLKERRDMNKENTKTMCELWGMGG